MSSRGARVTRGFIASGFATFVAALFHVAGGGQPPSTLALTLSLVFSALGCVVLAGKRSKPWRTVLSVALSQFLFHALFSLSPSAHFAGATGHIHVGTHLTMVSGGAVTMPDMMPTGPEMWASHLAAAAVTVATLLYGERVFRAVCAFTLFTLRQLLTVLTVVAVRKDPTSAETVPIALPKPVFVLGSLWRRGPPKLMGLA